jgi:hypothetical protein
MNKKSKQISLKVHELSTLNLIIFMILKTSSSTVTRAIGETFHSLCVMINDTVATSIFRRNGFNMCYDTRRFPIHQSCHVCEIETPSFWGISQPCTGQLHWKYISVPIVMYKQTFACNH